MEIKIIGILIMVISLLSLLKNILKIRRNNKLISGLSKDDFIISDGKVKECVEISKGVYKLTIE